MLDIKPSTIANPQLQALTSAVEKIIRLQFAPESIVSVAVEREHDYEGDLVFMIDVVLDERAGKFDAARASDLIGRLIPTIDAFEKGGFPLINYISHADFLEKRSGHI